MNIGSKTILELNKIITDLEKQENFYLGEMEIVFNRTQPQSVDCSKEMVGGGTKREDKFLAYAITCEEPWYLELRNDYDMAHARKLNLMGYINSRLILIGEYEPLKKRIIEMRENGFKWLDVAAATNYSQSQCRNIYRNYLKKRNIDT